MAASASCFAKRSINAHECWDEHEDYRTALKKLTEKIQCKDDGFYRLVWPEEYGMITVIFLAKYKVF